MKTSMLGTKRPEGLYELKEEDAEKIKRLLNEESKDENPSPEPSKPKIIPAEFDIKDPENYIILDGKTHGDYEYPDLLVSKYRLSYGQEVQEAANNLGLNLANTGKEANGREYIGNIQWNPALKLNLHLNRFTLNLRQDIDFISLLKSGKAFDGAKNKIDSRELENILKEILEPRDPWRSEWLDSDFKYLDKNGNQIKPDKNGDLWIYYNHILDKDGNLVPKKKEKLESYLQEDRMIDLSGCSKHGLPVKKGHEINYRYPRKDNNSVAGFDADSGGVGLVCDWGPRDSDGWLGVRSAKIFEG